MSECVIYTRKMATNLNGQLVVAISSRALFDFEQENEVFEQGDDRAYMDLQLSKLDEPAKPGVAFSLVKKLLAFNSGDIKRVETAALPRICAFTSASIAAIARDFFSGSPRSGPKRPTRAGRRH